MRKPSSPNERHRGICYFCGTEEVNPATVQGLTVCLLCLAGGLRRPGPHLYVRPNCTEARCSLRRHPYSIGAASLIPKGPQGGGRYETSLWEFAPQRWLSTLRGAPLDARKLAKDLAVRVDAAGLVAARTNDLLFDRSLVVLRDAMDALVALGAVHPIQDESATEPAYLSLREVGVFAEVPA